MQFIRAQHDLWHTPQQDGAPPVDVLTTEVSALPASPAALPPPEGHALLTWAQWLAVRGHWPAHLATGVILPNNAEVSELAPDLPRLKLVALEFPKWVDGRAYSQARLLRARHRFAGEVRAIGETLVDMVPLLARCGFDSVKLRADQDIAAAERALRHFDGLGQFTGMAHYQGDVLQPSPLFARQPGAAAATPTAAPAQWRSAA